MSECRRGKDIEARFQQCVAQLTSCGQEHVLRWWDDLDSTSREHLLDEIDSISWSQLAPLVETHVLNKPKDDTPTDLEPARVYPRVPDAEQAGSYEEATAHGRELIRAGKVAAFTVAGGQGTRLGFDGPKGAVPVSPIRNKTLFQLFAEAIAAARERYAAGIRWYVMTSPANREQTETFLRNHDFFGLPPEDIVLFSQAMLPSFDLDGKVLMEDKHRLALAPDGHGGSLKALVVGGALSDMQSRGIEILSYFQIDNPLVKPLDPLFIGLHAKTGSEMSTKITPKAEDLERVGNVCMHKGRVVVIEYSDFPDDLAHAKNADGSRKFDVGNLAMHLLDVAFVDRIIARQFQLPYRRAEKAVAFVDDQGVRQTPQAPNAVKLETFVFDALPLAKNAMLLEIDRAEEFSPVKNPNGVDSLESAVRDQIRRAARWLESAGVTIPRQPDGEPDATLEIAPSYALDAEDVKDHEPRPPHVNSGENVYLV
ncbi:MAG: UDPGP type 1 family protein [Planctomycetota bacterium]